jgi:hypothetical protein
MGYPGGKRGEETTMMPTIRIVRYLALSVLAAMLLSLGVPPGATRAAGLIPSVPFSAFYTETYLLPPCTPMVCTYPGHGTGFTSATGSMTETTSLTLRPATPSRCHVAQGETTFTDTQGNQLQASASGSACATSASGPLFVRMTFTITGGTGTYQNAGGSGTEVGWVYLQNTAGPPVAAFVWKGSYTPCVPCA